MRRIARIRARTDDMLIIRGVNVFPSQVEEQILADARLSPHYVLEISREALLDELAVRVEIHPHAAADTAARHLAGRELAHRVKAYVGVSVRVEVCDPGAVERSAGKAKRVIDRRT
jgi:phenylacetate-CoA ligase